MSKVQPELIHILAQNVYKTSVNASDEYLNAPTEIENIKVEYVNDTAFNLEENAIRIRLEVNLEAVNIEDAPIGLNANYGVEFHFEVENLEAFISEEEDSKSITGALGVTLLSIAYSTTRGIVFDRTQGTYFRGVILPVIDPKKLLVK